MRHLITYICIALLLLAGLPTTQAQSPSANAGADRSALVNETIVLNGSASTGGFDGLQVDGRHSYRWDFGYGGWTWEGGLTAPIAYPTAGTYTATLTVCNSGGTCVTDTATITVSAITEGSVTTIGDSGNPVTNGTNLCNAISTLASADNPVIQVTAGVIYRRSPSSSCDLPNRTGAGYLTIRTSAHASLPNDTTRVFPVDASNMAIMETGVHVNNSSQNSSVAIFRAVTQASPAHHYRFVGLHFRKTFPTLEYINPDAFLDFGVGSPTALSQLPHHIQIDRCFVDGGSATSGTTRGIAVKASDVAIVNSYIYRIKQQGGSDMQAIWVGMGERIAAINNYLNAATENFLTGGNDITVRLTEGTAQATGNDSTHIRLAASESSVNDFYTGKGIYINSGTGACCVGPAPGTYGRVIIDYDGATRTATVDPAFTVIPNSTSVYRIGDHVPTDLVIRRNHMPKELGWRSGDAAYYGVNFVVKNSFELKQCLRCSVQGNLIEEHWMEDQNWSTVLTVKNQSGRQPWARNSYIDYAHNKSLRVGNCFQILVSDWAAPSLGTDHLLIRHNICSGVSFYDGAGGFDQYAVIQDSQTFGALTMVGDRIMFVRNSTDMEGFDGKGRMLELGEVSRLQNFVLYGNIGQANFTKGGLTGSAALAAASGGGAGSYSVTKNGFYLPTGSNPADNTTMSTLAAVKYTSTSTHNLKLLSDSPFLTVGPAGGRAGADTDTVDTLTIGAVIGVWGDEPTPTPTPTPTPGTSTCKWSTSPPCTPNP